MKRFPRWCLLIGSVLVLSGCSTLADTPRSDDRSREFSPPAWASQSQGHSAEDIWFVGHGESGVEAEARRKAEAAAESLYVRFLGADVLVAERSVATTTSEDGINEDHLEVKQHASLSSFAFISEPRFEYITNAYKDRYFVWVRMFIPEQTHQGIKRDVNKAYRERNERLAEARQKVELNSRDGKQVFAMSVGTAIRGYNSRRPLRSESVAIDAARMDALVKLSENLKGSKIDNVRLNNGGLSRAYSGGHVYHDELSTRVWIIGGEVKATVTLLGWVTK